MKVPPLFKAVGFAIGCVLLCAAFLIATVVGVIVYVATLGYINLFEHYEAWWESGRD